MFDLRGKTVLLTGGTMGIGLATALKFGSVGARTILTCRFGSADEDEVRSQFAAIDAPMPLIVQADVANEEDTVALMDEIAREHDGVDIFISNVSFALRISGLEDYDKRALLRGIEYTSWPLWAYTRALRERFGRYPRYVVGLSSDGPDSYYLNYDFVAMSKSLLETLCRYMNYRLFDEGVRVNVVRSRMIVTESMLATFGEDFAEYLRRLKVEELSISPDDVAGVVVSLCSGWMDAVAGQVIRVDRGTAFFDNTMGFFERIEQRHEPL